MEKKDDEVVYICSPSKGRTPDTYVKGSIIRQCSTCHQDVLFSPSGWEIVERNTKLRLICTECALTEVKGYKELPTILPPTEKQKRELFDHFEEESQ